MLCLTHLIQSMFRRPWALARPAFPPIRHFHYDHHRHRHLFPSVLVDRVEHSNCCHRLFTLALHHHHRVELVRVPRVNYQLVGNRPPTYGDLALDLVELDLDLVELEPLEPPKGVPWIPDVLAIDIRRRMRIGGRWRIVSASAWEHTAITMNALIASFIGRRICTFRHWCEIERKTIAKQNKNHIRHNIQVIAFDGFWAIKNIYCVLIFKIKKTKSNKILFSFSFSIFFLGNWYLLYTYVDDLSPSTKFWYFSPW